MPEVLLVVFKATTKHGPWEPVKPEDVPMWVKDEKIMTHLIGGEYIQQNEDGVESDWFKVERLPH
jgi:hypothetical protein